ncbi:NAD kinase [Ravibacter arvi]|uniref:NAD kinase n=1 Tax=Ravibacter arvi TaxID=2051041 RepID=A0ABP8MCA9_9BACT
MKVVVHGKPFAEAARPFIQGMFDEMALRKIDVWISGGFEAILNAANIRLSNTTTFGSPADLNGARLVVSLGGDGTLLETVALIGARQIPVIGVNVGRLGFLATVPPERIKDMILALETGDYRIETRSILEVEANNMEIFGGVNFALNDLAITKTDTSSMITVHSYLNGEFLNSYWADGLIVSTPTGSTGYSLSCGGPVLVPNSKSLIVTPVSPHNLNVRPLVVEDSAVLSFEVKSRSNNFLLSLDSRSSIVDESTQLKVRKASFVARLVKMRQDNFFDTLRSKLSWGLDMRN